MDEEMRRVWIDFLLAMQKKGTVSNWGAQGHQTRRPDFLVPPQCQRVRDEEKLKCKNSMGFFLDLGTGLTCGLGG